MSPEDLFKKIYAEYYPNILRYVTRLAGVNDAEDITQEVFAKVDKGLVGFKAKSKLSTWIYRIATHTVIDKTRSASYKQTVKSIALKEGDEWGSQSKLKHCIASTSDHLVIRKEMAACIKEYIDHLSPEYKTIIILSELEGLSNKEIAEVLEISLANVKIRLHRARKKLKAVLNDACDLYYTEQNTLACDRKQIQLLSKTSK